MTKIKNSKKTITFTILITIAMLTLACSLQASFAADLRVNQTDQTAYNDINSALSMAQNDDSITIDPGTYQGSGENTGLTISKSLIIKGNGPREDVKIDANGSGRIFTINPGNNVTFINLTFMNGNSDIGGAIYSSSNNIYLTFINCSFTNNFANWDGGAIFNPGQNLTVINCEFTNNTGSWGGAIDNFGDGMVGADSNFINNTASHGGGAISNSGHNLNITNCEFTGNTANRDGGAISNGGVNMVVTGSNFIDNTALRGGAIYNEGVNAIVEYNRFLNNTINTLTNVAIWSGSVNANYNWWGSNADPSSLVNGSSVTINNYYTMIFNSTDTVNKTVGDNLSANYYFGLNGTLDGTEASKLPEFNTTITYNNAIFNITDARKSQTVTIPLTSAGATTITAITDNEIRSLTVTPFDVAKGNSTTSINLPLNISTGQRINITGVASTNTGLLKNTNITVYVNGKPFYNVKTGSDGSWIIHNYLLTTAGPLNVRAFWGGDGNFTGFNVTDSTTVSKGNITVKVTVVNNTDGSVTIIANATYLDGSPANGYSVQFFLNGKSVGNGKTVNGITTITIPPSQLLNGTNKVEVNLDGGLNFNNATGYTNFTYTPKKNDTNETNDTNDTDNDIDTDLSNDYSAAKASEDTVNMKKTSIPVIAIILVLMTLLGISFRRKAKR